MLRRVCSEVGLVGALLIAALGSGSCTNFAERGPETAGAASSSDAGNSFGGGLGFAGKASASSSAGGSAGEAASGGNRANAGGNSASAGDGSGNASASAGDGSGNASASAGAAPDPACAVAPNTGFKLGYYPETKRSAEEEIHPFFQIANNTGAIIALNRFKIRYYYSKEVAGTEIGQCIYVTGVPSSLCSSVVLSFQDVPAAAVTSTANRYLEVTFPTATTSVDAKLLEVRTAFSIGGEPLTQTNDYSYDPAAAELVTPGVFPYRDWDKVTLYLDGELIWGKEPC